MGSLAAGVQGLGLSLGSGPGFSPAAPASMRAGWAARAEAMEREEAATRAAPARLPRPQQRRARTAARARRPRPPPASTASRAGALCSCPKPVVRVSGVGVILLSGSPYFAWRASCRVHRHSHVVP